MALEYRNDVLHFDNASLATCGEQSGTPLYVYCQPMMAAVARQIDRALAGPTPHLVCYALKANPSLAVVQTFARLGLGADVTSGGELARALKAGVPPERIVFSGVGKKPDEVQQALAAEIKGLHVESEHEMAMLNQIAMEMGGIANIALRVNPDVDARTHPKIATGLSENKFGIPAGDIPRLVETLRDLPVLQLKGISMHIGSQITGLDVFQQAAQKIAQMAKNLLADGIPLEYLDFGGGLGVTYKDETPPSPSEWGDTLREAVGDLPLGLVVEPGRSLVAEAGVLISRVLGIKQTPAKTFVIIDAGMNDLIRPMLYDAYHPIWPVRRRDGPEVNVTIVGPICETTDTFARDRAMALPQAGDLIAITGAGAYGMSMASTYNSRPRPAEVMIDEKGDSHMIRVRETITDLMQEERLLP